MLIILKLMCEEMLHHWQWAANTWATACTLYHMCVYVCVVMAAATSEYLYVNTMRNVKLSTSIFVHKSSSMLRCGSLSIFFSHVRKHVSRVSRFFLACLLQLEIRRHFVRAHINYVAVIHRPQSTWAIIILSAQHRKLMIILLFSRVCSFASSLSFSVALSSPNK